MVLVCMIYYPDEAVTPQSWAAPALAALGYKTNPQKLQTLIRKAFTDATSRIRIPGTTVVPVPLFHVLNGKMTEEYVQLVEPSPAGGRKMAEYLLDMIQLQKSGGLVPQQHVGTDYATMSNDTSPTGAPTTGQMQDRD